MNIQISRGSKTRSAGILFGILLSVAALPLFADPSPRTNPSIAFDESISRVVLFGGLTGADSSRTRYPLGDTWEWTGRRWIQRFPNNSPEPRTDAFMVYDSARSRLVLFGGVANGVTFNDTWVYQDGNWTLLSPATSPSPRRTVAMAYDRARDRIVLYGGHADLTVAVFDTWEFDGTNWTVLQTETPKLIDSIAVYDEARDAVLLLGVAEDKTTAMYRWTGTEWEPLTPEKLPPCIGGGGLAFQLHNNTVLFTGGRCTTGVPKDDTWEWNGENWTEIEVATGSRHGAITNFGLAYDRARRNAVLFGGADFSVRASTYRYRDARWVFVNTDQFDPGPRSLFVFESDPARGVIWLFGGHFHQSELGDFWQRSEGRWHRIQNPETPVGCNYPVGAYDSDRLRLVILCEDSSTFEWDGEQWYKFAGVDTRPRSRRFSAMAYDAKNRKTVLFGGYDGLEYLKETWLWDGTKWTKAPKENSPTARSLASMFYDPNAQKVFMYGGIGRPNRDSRVVRYGDMWSFDGTKWTAVTTASPPPARYGAQVELNPITNHTVMFGGKSETEEYLDEQWEWDGTTWAQVTPETSPQARMNAGLAFDFVAQKLTLYGGYAGLYYSDVWTLDGNRWRLQPERLDRRRSSVVRRSTGSSRSTRTGE